MTRRRPEDALQRACTSLLDVYEAQGLLRYFAVPNGGKRSRIEAAIMKGLGVRAGVPDLVVLPAASERPTIFCELKSATGRLSGGQRDWRGWLEAHGYAWALITNIEELQEALRAEEVIR